MISEKETSERKINWNKKANSPISIALLVLLTISICSYTLYMFYKNDQKIILEISGAEVVNIPYNEKEKVDFYLSKVSRDSFFESYSEFLKQGLYIDNPVENPSGSGNFEFEMLDVNLNEKFMQFYLSNLEKNFDEISFSNYNGERLKSIIKNKEYEYSFDGNNIGIRIKDMDFVNHLEKNGLSAVYKTDIIYNTSFAKLGLNSFSEIYNTKETCIARNEITKECFSSLDNFDVEVDSSNNLVSFKSKKKVYSGEDFSNIEFSFILQKTK
ncbi:MAG: hypothetical protein AABX30_03520 [Nanoarchaeota archaeon]